MISPRTSASELDNGSALGFVEVRKLTSTYASYFFKVDLADRSSRLLVDRVDDLREVVRDVHKAHPFEIIAWVVMPNHLHAVWQLSDGDSDYSMRWGQIKSNFCGLGLRG